MATTTFSGPVVSENGFSGPTGTFTSSVTIGGNTLTGSEFAALDGVTAGTAAAGKAVILDSNKAIATITTATITTLNSTTVNATTVDSTNVEVTNIKAKDGTAAVVITDATGAVAVSTATTFSNASVKMTALPVADPVVAGALWNDSGTVKVSAG